MLNAFLSLCVRRATCLASALVLPFGFNSVLHIANMLLRLIRLNIMDVACIQNPIHCNGKVTSHQAKFLHNIHL